MVYYNSKYVEKARFNAVKEVINGKSVAETARRYGCYRSTIYYWLKRYKELETEAAATGEIIKSIPTKSSRPHHYPNRISPYIENLILELRKSLGRCAEVIHQEILHRGLYVSLSSVRRVLKRHNLTKKHGKYYIKRTFSKRPPADYPGDLVEVDTVIFKHPITKQYKYVTSVIDVRSRMAYAYVHDKFGEYNSFMAVLQARQYFPFSIKMVQTDNGTEFGKRFRKELNKIGINYRHTRVRKPNDNAHVERFNRTLRNECLGRYIPHNEILENTRKRVEEWLYYYNYKRLHIGINLMCPIAIATALNF